MSIKDLKIWPMCLGLLLTFTARADHLVQAIHEGDIESLQSMLNVGTEIDQPGGSWVDRGSTRLYFVRGSALHYAVQLGHEDMVRLLIEHGATIDVRDRNDLTPLHNAAWAGNIGMVTLLIEAGADAQATTPDGDTPLSRALDNNRTEVAEYLQARFY